MSPPALQYTVTPVYDKNEAIASLKVEITISGLVNAAEKTMLTLPIQIAGVEVGLLVNGTIMASDAAGPLDLSREVEKPGPPIVLQKWKASRTAVGPVHVHYEALLRQVTSTTRNAPSFDFRLNFGGAISSGYGFLACPPSQSPDQEVEVQVEWDLTHAPPMNRAIWTFGEGPNPVCRTMKCAEIQATYFMVGRVSSHGDERFGMYWMGDPPFDAHRLSNSLRGIFQFMAEFFDDQEDPYRIFIRYNPYQGSGAGTALVRSFAFSYDDSEYEYLPPAEDKLLFLCHEMTHNWVVFRNDIFNNWYAEGMAEYFSLLFPLQMKMLSPERFRIALNERLFSYYTNALVHESSEEVAKLTWKQSEAQRIPYGRGLVFAHTINTLIRDTTEGAKDISNLVQTLLRRERTGDQVGPEEYVEELGILLGGETSSHQSARELVEYMCAGKFMIPPENGLWDLGLKAERRDAPVWELRFDESAAIQGYRVIENLNPKSQAARAGVQEGDHVLKLTPWDKLRGKEAGIVKLVLRGPSGEVVNVSFSPRGSRMMEVWQYVRRSS